MPAQRKAKPQRKDAQLDKPPSQDSAGSGSSADWMDEVSTDEETPASLAQMPDGDFMTVPQPMADFRFAHRCEIESMSASARKKLNKTYNDTSEAHVRKDPKDFPDWPWVISKRAFKMWQDMDVALQKRDPDAWGMHIYSDWYGYGMHEVVETHLKSFHKEFVKKKGADIKVL